MNLPREDGGRCYMIGLQREELEWVRLLVRLLRHADPLAPELARQALEYVATVADAARPAREPLPAAK